MVSSRLKKENIKWRVAKNVEMASTYTTAVCLGAWHLELDYSHRLLAGNLQCEVNWILSASRIWILYSSAKIFWQSNSSFVQNGRILDMPEGDWHITYGPYLSYHHEKDYYEALGSA